MALYGQDEQEGRGGQDDQDGQDGRDELDERALGVDAQSELLQYEQVSLLSQQAFEVFLIKPQQV